MTVCFLVLAAFDPLEQNFTELVLWTWAGILLAGAQAKVPASRPENVAGIVKP